MPGTAVGASASASPTAAAVVFGEDTPRGRAGMLPPPPSAVHRDTSDLEEVALAQLVPLRTTSRRALHVVPDEEDGETERVATAVASAVSAATSAIWSDEEADTERPVISPKKTLRKINARSTSYNTQMMQLMANMAVPSPARPSHVVVRMRGGGSNLHSPSHSMSGMSMPPCTHDLTEEEATTHQIRSHSSHLLSPEFRPPMVHQSSSTTILDREMSSPSSVYALTPALTPHSGTCTTTHGSPKKPLSIQIHSPSTALSTNVENLTPKPPQHHRKQQSWMGDELPAPPSSARGHRKQQSWMGDEIPPSARGHHRTPSNAARIHVMRVQERESAPPNSPNGRVSVHAAPPSAATRMSSSHCLAIYEECKPQALGDTPWHKKMETAQYRPDGELEATFLARKRQHRQHVVLRSFCMFIFIFAIAEIPYAMYSFAASAEPGALTTRGQTPENRWLWSANGTAFIIRYVMCALLALAAYYMRRRHASDSKEYAAYLCSQPKSDQSLGAARASHSAPYRFFRADAFVGCLVCIATTSSIVAEAFRDPLLIETNLLVQDGLLLAMTLQTSYLLGFLRIGRLQALIQMGLLFSIYNGCYLLFYRDHTTAYLLKSDAYLVLLFCSFGIYHLQLREFARKQLENSKTMNSARRRSDKLLRSMLPGPVYSTVLQGVTPYLSAIATIGFCNVELTFDEGVRPSPVELMQRLHDMFKRLDAVVEVYKSRSVYKIETVSKTYLLCSGLLEAVEDHAASVVDVLLEIMHLVERRTHRRSTTSKITTNLRIGIATGPVVGGIIGTQRRFFRIFGDTVNVAARMCTNCKPGQIQMNKCSYDSLNETQRAQYVFPSMRVLEIKGKGSMECHLVERRDTWQPRFGKAVLNRGKEGEDDSEGSLKEISSSFVYHQIVRATSLMQFPLMLYKSTFEHHDAELLKNEGPSSTTAQHIEYRFQISQFNLWARLTKWNIAAFFIWSMAAFGVVMTQKIRDIGKELEPGTTPFNASFAVLCCSMIVMLAVHFIFSYALGSNNYYKKHAQMFTAVFAAGISSWILALTAMWGLNNGPIAPHFAFLLLNYYACLFLHLQLRYSAPLMSATLIGFCIIMIVKYEPFDILFAMIHLTAGTFLILLGIYKGESRIRSNYLLQYALEMEQTQLDHFLKNLLPQFVVSVLKQRSVKPTSVAMTRRGSVIMEPTDANFSSADGEWSQTGSHVAMSPPTSGFDPIPTTTSSPPTHHRRRSVFDFDGASSMTGGGGLSSRFAMHFPNATVFESDIVGYTQLVSQWPAQRTLNLLNDLFSLFDEIAQKCAVEKIETIGDAFMCLVFENEPDAVLNFALDALSGLRALNQRRPGETPLEMRSGVCTGPCYGGIVGSDVPRFALAGFAHDSAILIEQNGRPGTAMVSDTTVTQAGARYQFERRADIVCEGVEQVYQLLGRFSTQAELEQNILHETTITPPPPAVAAKEGWM